MTILKTQLMTELSSLNKVLYSPGVCELWPTGQIWPWASELFHFKTEFCIFKELFKREGSIEERRKICERAWMWHAKIKNIYLIWPFSEVCWPVVKPI